MLKELFLLSSCFGVIYGLRTCDYNGVIYQSGDRFTSSDNCNTCFCTNGVVPCTLKFCLPNPLKVTCSYGNSVYNDGDSFKSLDKCNTCNCQNGMISCTEMFCMPTEVPPP